MKNLHDIPPTVAMLIKAKITKSDKMADVFGAYPINKLSWVI